jgi:hypothetical protein
MDANNLGKAREISTQLLRLCQTKQLPLLSNLLQFLVSCKYQTISLFFSSISRLSIMLSIQISFYHIHLVMNHRLYSIDYLLNLHQFIG